MTIPVRIEVRVAFSDGSQHEYEVGAAIPPLRGSLGAARLREVAEDPVVAFAAARIAEDQEREQRAGDGARIAWLTLRDDAGQMRYTTVAAEGGEDGWLAMGEEVPRPYSVLVIYDPDRARREIAARPAIIGRQESDHAPVETVYGVTCRTCVDWLDDEGAREFGIAIPQAWPCRVAKSVLASWSGHPEYREAWKP